MDKLAKKASAYNCKFDYSFGSEKVVTRDVYTVDVDGFHRTKTGTENVYGIEITIDSDIIRKDGYTVIASIDHDTAGNVVNVFDESITVPVSWYTMTPYCEHCGTRHVKRHTYMVMDPTGKYIQVGKSCLKDYCGIEPAFIAAAAEITDLIVHEYDIDEYEFSSGQYAYDVCDVIAAANDLISKYGYVKSGEMKSTKERLVSGFNTFEPSAESKKLAAEMKEYFSGLDYADLTNYQRNLKSLLSSGYTRSNAFGYLAYAPIEYKKMIEKQERDQSRKAAAANSEYMGNVGDRITVTLKDSKLVSSWETVYGMTYLYKFIAANDSVIVWYASKHIENMPAKITGTVKEHKEYNGEKQTVVTRCKVA